MVYSVTKSNVAALLPQHSLWVFFASIVEKRRKKHLTSVCTIAGLCVRNIFTVWKMSTTPSYLIRSKTMLRVMKTPVLPTPALCMRGQKGQRWGQSNQINTEKVCSKSKQCTMMQIQYLWRCNNAKLYLCCTFQNKITQCFPWWNISGLKWRK